jgi:ribose 5-phosphate isomerase B
MTRMHNDSNVLALSERSMTDPSLSELVAAWLAAPFEGGRHQRRVDEITAYESKE